MESNDKWYLTYCQRIHKKKLNHIKNCPGKRIDNLEPASLGVVNLRQKVFQMKRFSVSKDLVKQNQNIVNRISQITKKISQSPSKVKLKTCKSQKISIKSAKPETYKKAPSIINSPVYLKATKAFNYKKQVESLSSFAKLPKLKLANSIKILKAPSPDTLDNPIPPYVDTSFTMRASQNSYIKIYSPISQTSSKNDSMSEC